MIWDGGSVNELKEREIKLKADVEEEESRG